MIADSRILLEGDVRTKEAWRGLLGDSVGHAVVQELIDKSALRKTASRVDLYRLDFVGLIAFNRRTFFCMPKVYEGATTATKPSEISRIVRCIQKYQTRRRRNSVATTIGEDPLFDDAGPLLNVFISMMAWTRDHGIHHLEAVHVSDGQSNINWAHTFDNAVAGHLRTGPIFAELFSFEESRTESQLGLMQALALKDLHSMFGIVAELWASKFDPLMEMCRETVAYSSHYPMHRDEMRAVLGEAELGATRDHDRELTNLLIQWFDLTAAARKGLRLFGVNAFHAVWEDICAVALAVEPSIDKHSTIASQALHSHDEHTLRLASQRPDQIMIEGEKVWIGDAKWFRPWRDEFPPLPDVIKQVMYGLTVSEDYEVVKNYFLMPTMNSMTPLVSFGEASMAYDGKKDDRFPTIEVIGANWNVFLERYVSNTVSNVLSDQLRAS